MATFNKHALSKILCHPKKKKNIKTPGKKMLIKIEKARKQEG